MDDPRIGFRRQAGVTQARTMETDGTRHVSFGRIAGLFRPHRLLVACLLALVCMQAALNIASPLLLRDIVDRALPHRDTTLLSLLVGGMIAASLTGGVLGVISNWLSSTIGQRILHGLRTDVYAHLQRMSLAFFTRTRTGEVQSRIANDIGAVDSIVTDLAASVVQSTTSVIGLTVALLFLNWQWPSSPWCWCRSTSGRPAASGSKVSGLPASASVGWRT